MRAGFVETGRVILACASVATVILLLFYRDELWTFWIWLLDRMS
jgi:hypothetical protein